MHRHLVALPGALTCAVLLLCAPCGAAFAQAPLPVPPPPPVPPGSAIISGIVLADDGTPVRRVGITARWVTGPLREREAAGTGTGIRLDSASIPSTSAETGPDGRFSITGLPGGEYQILVSRVPGFVPRRMPSSVRLADGGSAPLTLRLIRTGVITGRVTNAEGDPVRRARVQALKWTVTSGGSPGLAAASGGDTDDRGEYRLFDLPPGRYRIVASTLPPSRAAGQPLTAPVPTFYPGTTAVDEAAWITVTRGSEASGVDIALVEGVLGTVRVRVDWPVDADRARQRVSLTRVGDSGGFVSPSETNGGHTVFWAVPPGDYFIAAHYRPTAPNGEGLAAVRRVSVNGDTSDVSLTLNSGATITGRVAVERPHPPIEPDSEFTRLMGSFDPLAGSVALQAAATTPLVFGGVRACRVIEAGGRCTLSGLWGPVRLSASTTWGGVRAIRLGERDLLHEAVTLRGTEALDVDIVISAEVGFLDGTVDTTPVWRGDGASLLLFPEDLSAALSQPPSGIRRVVRTPGRDDASVPRFTIGPLPAGRHRLIALEDDGGAWYDLMADPDRLRELHAAATPVDVKAGKRTSVKLPLTTWRW